MTGYAQARKEEDGWAVRVSVKSVNHRFLDLKLRMPDGFDFYELRLRQMVRVRFDGKQRPDLVIYHKGRWGKFGGPNSLIRARSTDFGGGAAYYDEGVRLEPPAPE